MRGRGFAVKQMCYEVRSHYRGFGTLEVVRLGRCTNSPCRAALCEMALGCLRYARAQSRGQATSSKRVAEEIESRLEDEHARVGPYRISQAQLSPKPSARKHLCDRFLADLIVSLGGPPGPRRHRSQPVPLPAPQDGVP